MKIKIPLTKDWMQDYVCSDFWLCGEALREHFNITTDKITLVLSSRSSKESYLVKITGWSVTFLDIKGEPSHCTLPLSAWKFSSNRRLINKEFYVSIEDA